MINLIVLVNICIALFSLTTLNMLQQDLVSNLQTKRSLKESIKLNIPSLFGEIGKVSNDVSKITV